MSSLEVIDVLVVSDCECWYGGAASDLLQMAPVSEQLSISSASHPLNFDSSASGKQMAVLVDGEVGLIVQRYN